MNILQLNDLVNYMRVKLRDLLPALVLQDLGALLGLGNGQREYPGVVGQGFDLVQILERDALVLV